MSAACHLQMKSRVVEIQPSNAELTVPKTPQFAKAKSHTVDHE